MTGVKKTSANAIGSGKPGPGRPAGVPNKLTRDVKEMILGALEAVGGQKYLERQARKNPQAFMTLVGKCLPLQHTGEGGGPVIAKLEVSFVGAK